MKAAAIKQMPFVKNPRPMANGKLTALNSTTGLSEAYAKIVAFKENIFHFS